jgi:hypothetical protein
VQHLCLQGITKSQKGGHKPPFSSDQINGVLRNAGLWDESPLLKRRW